MAAFYDRYISINIKCYDCVLVSPGMQVPSVWHRIVFRPLRVLWASLVLIFFCIVEMLSQNEVDFHVKQLLYFCQDFGQTFICSTDLYKTLKYQISQKSVLCKPSCSVRTDRQTWKRRLYSVVLRMCLNFRSNFESCEGHSYSYSV